MEKMEENKTKNINNLKGITLKKLSLLIQMHFCIYM